MIWLIVLAVFFSKAFVSSGLGDRVATYFVSLFGGSSLGLGYGLALSEALIAPAMPSTTARASIYVPLVDSLAAQQGSYSLAKDPSGASARRLGAFLSQCHLQTSVHSSAASLTSAAQNLLGLKASARATPGSGGVPSVPSRSRPRALPVAASRAPRALIRRLSGGVRARARAAAAVLRSRSPQIAQELGVEIPGVFGTWWLLASASGRGRNSGPLSLAQARGCSRRLCPPSSA